MRTLLALLMVLTVVAYAQADTILAPGSTWEYTFSDPTGNGSWNTTTGGWETGLAPFGNVSGGYPSDPTGLFDYKTFWAPDNTGSLDDDLWVRTSINLTGYDLTSINWDLGVDNGFKLYVNGSLVANANAEGYTYRWEYSSGGTAIPSAILHSGMNVVAVALEDHGGLTAFDMQITGTKAVPEPATVLLLGAGLAGLVALRRRFN